MAQQITVYGADWCGDTRRTLRYLDKQKIEYDYVDVDTDQAGERKVVEFSKGKRRIPLVEVGSDDGGSRSVAVPSDDELGGMLKG